MLYYNCQVEGGGIINYDFLIQSVLDNIDERITENIRVDELARTINYSVYHFCRIFMTLTGTPVMSYVIRRKLEYAQYDLSQGRRIVDVAMDYGFETHAGFTKAFKKVFGYPPSLYRLHISASPPEKATVCGIKFKHGGINLQVQIKEVNPLTIAGYTSRHRIPGVNNVSDIPGFWEKINLEYEAALSTLHHTYTKSHHCEAAVCFDIDEKHDCFTYMLGVGVDEADADVPQRPGTYLYKTQGGLYAIFTTPLADEAQYVQAIHDTWKQILDHWLVESEYKFDSTRADYEYYDERDHGKTAQMDIYIPICPREKV
jgi:AraC-type DNA-binding domain-containing proteins